MDATLNGVLELLAGPDVEARCAALLVLTHLGADEPRVVREAGAVLSGRNVVARDFALGYFERVRPGGGVEYLVALLDVEDQVVRQRVVGILASYGAAAIAASKKRLVDAPRRRVNAVIQLCSQVRSAAALDLLFGFMAGDDFDAHRAACDALIAAVPALDERCRADLFARTGRLVAEHKAQRTSMVAAAKLFAALGDAKARRLLFAMLGPGQPQIVRTHALAGLVQCLRGKALAKSEVDALLPLLDEEDEAAVLRPAVRLLEDQPFDRSYLARLNRLAESPQPAVKRFAVMKLGTFDSTAVVKTLIGYLTDDSYARRDQAATSLKTIPAARTPLMKEFLACDDERTAWALADILLLHDRSWKRGALDELWKELEKALEKRDDRLYAVYFQFLDTLDAAWVSQRVRDRAERLRKSKRFADSARYLLLLQNSPGWDENTQYGFALAELKSHRHKLGTPARRRDAALDALRTLVESPFPLGERLCRERTLDPEDLYYVAFRLAEDRGDAQGVARQLLQYLTTKHARTKAGKAARNKLKLVEP